MQNNELINVSFVDTGEGTGILRCLRTYFKYFDFTNE